MLWQYVEKVVSAKEKEDNRAQKEGPRLGAGLQSYLRLQGRPH